MAVTPKVLLKRSSVVGRVPSASDLQYGEIAINFVDGKIYYKDASNNVKAFIDSARVQAIAANEAGNFLDSAEAISLIDSAHIQLRQSYDYNSLINKPNILDSADVLALAYDSAETQTLIFSLIDSAYIRSIQSYDADTLDGQDGTYYLDWTNVTNKPDLIDSSLTIQLIDSSYIKNTIDSSYINVNINQTTIENIIDATYINNIIDSALIQNIVNQDYITNTIDSSVLIRIVNENALDSSEVVDLIDSDYLRNRVRQLISSVDQGGDGSFSYNQYTGVMTYTGPSAAEVRSHFSAGGDLSYDSSTGVFSIDVENVYTDANFDSDLRNASTTDLPEGTNLYYTKARADSDIAASLNDSGNTVNITINNTIEDKVDSAYVLARVQEAPFLDSTDAIQLIDSAYIQLRDTPQDFAYTSLTGTPTIPSFGNDYIDSQTVLDIITREGLDSDLVISLVDSAYIALRDRFQDSSLVTSTVDATYVQALQITYSNVSEFTNDANYLDSTTAQALIDSAYIETRRPAETIFNVVNSGSSAYTFTGDGFSSGANNPTLYLQRGKTYKFNINASSHPFQIRVSNGGSAYNTGVTNNGQNNGVLLFTPDMSAPNTLVYQCTVHGGMVGDIVILDDTTGGLDSASIIQLIDSDYVQARQSTTTPTITIQDSGVALTTAASTLNFVGPGVVASGNGATKTITITGGGAGGGGGSGTLDSGNIDTIVDSAYIKFRVDYDANEELQFGKDQYALGTLTGSTSGTNIYTAFNPGQADGLFTSSYNYANGGVDIDQWVWGYYWVNSGLGYAQIATKVDNGNGTYTYTTSPALNWAGGWTNYVVLADRAGGEDTPLKIRYNSTSDVVEFNAKKQIRIYHSDESDRPLWINASYLDLNGSPVYFSNRFDSNSLFPSATDYPGMIATFDSNVTNGPGAAYISLEGAWTKISGTGIDSGEAKKVTLEVIDSDHFIPGKGERNWNITSASPPEISTGDLWLDRDDYILYRLTASSNWTSSMPAHSFAAYPGLTSTDWANSGGGTNGSFSIDQSNTPPGPNGTFASTFTMGTSPYNSGGQYTFSNPVNLGYFYIGNLNSGWIHRIDYVDGSYAKTNTGPTGQPSNITWYNYDNTSMGTTRGYGSGTTFLYHPNGVLATSFVIGRSNYGTRNYEAWIFFSGSNYWNRVGEIYDSSDIKNLIDSAYIQERQSGGGSGTVDSADIIAIVDSAYVQARQTSGGGGGLDSAAVLSLIDSDYIAAATGSNAAISQTHFHYSADSGQTIFSGADDDSATLSYVTDGIMVFLNGILLIDSVDYTATDGSTITLLDSAALSDVVSVVKMNGTTGETSIDSADVISIIDSAYINARIGAGTVEAIVDSAYIQLRDRFQEDSNFVTNIVDSSYIQARVTASANIDSIGAIGNVNAIGAAEGQILKFDSASQKFILASDATGGGGGGGSGTVDSAQTISLIEATVDSDYIGTKVDFTRGEFTTQRSQYSATASQTVFNHSSIDPTHLDVYLNGVLQVVNDDYTANSSAVTFTSGVDSGYSVTIVERRGRILTQRGLVESKYYFTTSTPITTITGTDDNGITLDYSDGSLDVYLNGILLKDSDDYSTNSGTSVTLVSATDSNDLVTLINRKGVVVTPNVKNYEFTATAGQTTFSGSDNNGNTLAYVPGAAQVFLNGILLRNVDYTGITGTSIVLVDSASLNDELVVSAFSNPGQNMDLYKFTADSGQTIFSGNDLTGASLAYQPGNIQVFMNGLLLNDSDDYTASNGMSVVLTSGADASDEIKIASFVSNADVIRTNAWTAPTGTPVTAAAGDKLFIDTSSAKTVTLPSSASMGDEIRIIDVTGNASTNNITVSRNGHNIQGAASDLTINVDRAGIGLVYYNSAQGWVLIEN